MFIDYMKLYKEEYILNKKSMSDIAKELKINSGTVSRNFDKLGLDKRNNKVDFSKINEFAFDKWSVEMAYWLGFIAADGNVYNKSNSIFIRLNYLDKGHLIKFSKFIGLEEENIKDYTYKNNLNSKEYYSSYVYFSNKHIKERLVSLGIEPSKSYKMIDFIENVPEKYKIYFILGYFDGDGTIAYVSNRDSYCVGFCGNHLFMGKIELFFREKYGFNKVKVVKSGNVSSVMWGSIKDVKKFNEIYKSLLSKYYYLDRKMNRMNKSLKICNVLFKEKRINWPSKEELEDLIKLESFESIGRRYNVSGKSVSKWCLAYGLPYRKKDIKKTYILNNVEKLTGIDFLRAKTLNSKSGYKNVYLNKSKKILTI
jgi:hypothetical protein